MKFILRSVFFLAIFLILNLTTAGAETFSKRFEKGQSDFGAEIGWGWTMDLPPGRDRTDLSFLFFSPNWQKNLTGVIGKSWYQGSLFYHLEGDFAIENREGKYLAGFSPVMAQYKFLSPKRRWAPNILAGAGFSMTNWKDLATRELGSEFEFLLHLGGGIEFFTKEGAYSINYRLFHVSNAGTQRPNIGLNAHMINFGMRF
jgi:lipid A 3-O-deacylase